MNKESPPNTMTYVALIVLALVMMCVSLIAKERVILHRTDADVVRLKAQESAAPVAAPVEEDFSFAGKPIDQAIHANFQRIQISLQPQVNTCLRKWPNHPDRTRIYIETDAAGRLSRLEVENASPAVSQCLGGALALGQFARRASGIAEMNLARGRSRDAYEYH